MDETFTERQQRENQRQYKQWLSCGFKGEMHLNDCGWCDNGISLSKHEQAKKIILFDKHPFSCHIECMELPNGAWIVGSWLNCPLHGYCHGISVWSKQYESEADAINAELDRIENALEEKDRKPFVLQALQAQRNNYKQVEIELAFEPMTQFEQVALF